MTSRVALITGASGFLGRWAVRGLLSRGFDVHAIGAPSDLAPPAELQGAVFHRVDLLDPAALRRLSNSVKASHLVHFAWVATPGIYWTSPQNFDWTAATLTLLRLFREAGGKRFVGVGSCAEYDWTRANICDEFSTPLVLDADAPTSPYATCKAALGKIVASYGAADDFSAAWGRVFFQYGPHEHPARIVSSIIGALLEGREAHCSHGRQIRSFLSAMDVGDAFAALAAGDVRGPVNIASDEAVTLADLATKIGQLLGRPELIMLGKRSSPADEPPVLLAKLNRLEVEVGWKPHETLSSGLEKTIDWWRGQAPISLTATSS